MPYESKQALAAVLFYSTQVGSSEVNGFCVKQASSLSNVLYFKIPQMLFL